MIEAIQQVDFAQNASKFFMLSSLIATLLKVHLSGEGLNPINLLKSIARMRLPEGQSNFEVGVDPICKRGKGPQGCQLQTSFGSFPAQRVSSFSKGRKA